jgi:hypothetical protein
MTTHDEGKSRLLVPCMIFVFFCGFYLYTAKGAIYLGDGLVNFQTVRSLVERQSLAVDCAMNSKYTQTSQDGQCYSKYDLGLAVASLPLYCLARPFSGPAPAHPDALSLGKLFISTFNQLVTAATCAVLYLTALQLSDSRGQALTLAFAFGLFTLAWPYSSTYFAQPLVGLLLLVAFLILCRRRSPSCRPYAAAGLALAYASFTRLDSVVLAAVIGVYAWHRLRRHGISRRRGTLCMACLLSPTVLAVIAHVMLNHVRSGNAWQLGYPGEGWTTPILTGLYGLLFSPGRGIVLYSPLVILAILGLPKLRKRGCGAEAALIGALIIAQLAIYAPWHAWEGGWSWGPRFLVSTQPLLILGLLPWIEREGLKLPILVLSSIGFTVQMIGALTNPVTYHMRTNYTFSETLFSIPASPLPGHLQDLLHRRVYLLLTTRAHGVITSQATMIFGVICALMMAGSGKTLLDAAARDQAREGLDQA